MKVYEAGGRVRTIYGTAMTAGATPREAAEAWLAEHGAVFGTWPDLEEFRKARLRNAPPRTERRVFMYRQNMDALPVVGSSFRVMTQGEPGSGPARVVYAAGRVAIRSEGGLPAPTVTSRQALAAAQAHPTGQRLGAWSEPELVAIYDDPPLGNAEAYPAWKCVGSGTGAGAGVFESYSFYVDALTGEVVRTHSNVMNAFDITGRVIGNATPADTNATPKEKLGPNTLPLSNLWSDCPNVPAPADLSNVLIRAYRQQTLVASAYTDSNGNYTLDVPDTMVVDIEAHLVGPMWYVLDGTVQPFGEPLNPLVEAGVTAPNTVNFEFNPTPTSMNEEETAFVDAHFQIDRTLQYLDLWDADALPDVPIVVNSSEIGCNAQYLLPGPDGPPSPGLLRFTRSATSCANHAYSTVIAHEYGHFVLVQLLGIDVILGTSAGFHEGFADTLAHLVYDTEIVGQDRIGCDTYWRDPLHSAHNTYPICPTVIFPSCISEHCYGQLLSATWLRILERMRLRYPQGTEGWDRTRTLHLDWIYLAQVPGRAFCSSVNQDWEQSADEGTLIEVLTADDDDDTLANGTPHCEQILEAFAAGKITPSFQIICNERASGPGRSCYVDFDASTGPGVLDVFDYLAFQNLFLESDLQACDCDTTSGPGVCDVFDYICFQSAFAAGCEKE